MRRMLPALALLGVLLAATGTARARGLVIPTEKSLPPLGMLNHKVTIALEEQVAVTKVEQAFRNHTDRKLEAAYVFPVPKGASVNKFTMWVDGKETKGEMVEADKAKAVYTDIVRQAKDPGLLEYLGGSLLRVRVSVPAKGDLKMTVHFTAVAPKEGKLVEYLYPLKTDGRAVATLESFSIQATVKSEAGVSNVYSPSHALDLKRVSAKEVHARFGKDEGLLDRNFQLFYTTGKDDIGLSVLTHRPVSAEKGYFTLLVSPRVDLSEKARVARDVVFVLDTSGSMRGAKMEQARRALGYCLKNLHAKDRFGLINFATSVNRYEDKLLDASAEQVTKAVKWVDELEATGGTAINDALASALELRPKGTERPFTVVFFTDGQPTIGETDPEKIYKAVKAKNTAETRIFTFGVGDDVNAALLDRISADTRALSAYVREKEDIEAKVSGLYSKISHPVFTDLRLTATAGVKLSDVFPVQLPDLFHGGQLVVMGRFTGSGPAAIKLSGQLGKEGKTFAYDFKFPEKTDDGREFVEHLWARRKVGYLLDQVRVNGEKKELVDEVVSLAKRYGITTPYTSYLIVPDGTTVRPLAAKSRAGMPKVSFEAPGTAPVPRGLTPMGGSGKAGGADPKAAKGPAKKVEEFARETGAGEGGLASRRDKYAEDELKGDKGGKDDPDAEGDKKTKEARERKAVYEETLRRLKKRDKDGVTTGKFGVDLTLEMNNLRNSERVERTATRNVLGRNCLEVGGVWIDEGFGAKTAAVTVKAQSDAYFRMLERHPKVKTVFALGNHLVWVTPSGTALVIDTTAGKEKMTDGEIDKLFVAPKK